MPAKCRAARARLSRQRGKRDDAEQGPAIHGAKMHRPAKFLNRGMAHSMANLQRLGLVEAHEKLV